ncbi:MAG: hypothetical protein MUQ99_03985, partial [Pseudomonadales bacterium]|nr:hypothetical protein [Pseudomonadales bacterium]
SVASAHIASNRFPIEVALDPARDPARPRSPDRASSIQASKTAAFTSARPSATRLTVVATPKRIDREHIEAPTRLSIRRGFILILIGANPSQVVLGLLR